MSAYGSSRQPGAGPRPRASGGARPGARRGPRDDRHAAEQLRRAGHRDCPRPSHVVREPVPRSPRRVCHALGKPEAGGPFRWAPKCATSGDPASARSPRSGVQRAPTARSCRSRRLRCAAISRGVRRSAYTRCSRMKPAGSSRSTLTVRRGRTTLAPCATSRSRRRSRYWSSARDRDTGRTYGSCSRGRSPPGLREPSAAGCSRRR